MLEKISITCFAASYAVAFALELTRLLFKSGIRGAVMLGFAAAGLVAHSMYIAARMRQTAYPLSSELDWYLLAAWLLVVVYLYLTAYHPRNPIGVFLLPLVLGLVLAASLWASRTPVAQAEGRRLWGLVHGGSLLVGTVAGAVGFVAGLMYLWHARRLRLKLPPRIGFQLPSLEWLQKVNERSILITAAMVLCGFASGLVLSWLNDKTVSWGDPAVWTTSVLAVWMLVAATFNLVYRPARQGRKVAYLTLATFVFLVCSLGSLLVEQSHHGREEAQTPTPPVVSGGRGGFFSRPPVRGLARAHPAPGGRP